MDSNDQRLIAVAVVLAAIIFIEFFNDDPCRVLSDKDENMKRACAERRHAVSVYDGRDLTGGIIQRRK